MNFLKSTFGFLSVFCVFFSGIAATARPGVVNTNAVVSASGRRMPSLNSRLSADATVTTSYVGAGAGVSTVTMNEVECVEAYTECLADEEACGTSFEECTTNVLFHGQMPDCTSTLMQCPASAIVKLFGAGAGLTNLSNVAEYNDDNEIIRYTYPLTGSILDQKIEAARIENMYDDQTCVKRYTNCLKRDDVCGENFELCTSKKNFKKQALNCDSYLTRCAMSGVRKMFGDKVQNKSMNKANGLISGIDDVSDVGGTIATLISEGADYVALNAVSSCYKKVDACILAACDANPLRCVEGTSLAAISEAEKVGVDAGQSDFKTTINAGVAEEKLTASHINRYLRSQCADAIGGFEACHITYMGAKPKAKDLADRDVIEEVFNVAHNDRKSILESKIQGRLQIFDTNAKDACRETIRTCAMRACGGGIGSVCYSKVFGTGGSNTINNGNTYDDIKTACEPIVNSDKNCIYAYASKQDDSSEYAYINASVFDTLFPGTNAKSGDIILRGKTDSDLGLGYSSSDDPIGIIGELNSLLATNFNDAMLAQMKTECESAAKGCVRSLCGKEYEACFRNRSDVFSNITNTGMTAFDDSMNKVGGVLDYTVVVGLCMDTVKNNDACNEHLAIARAKAEENNAAVTAWGTMKDSNVRSAWVDAGGASKITGKDGDVQKEDEDGNKICKNTSGDEGFCNTSDVDGNMFSTPVYVSWSTYTQSLAENSFFRELVYDLEKEAQAKYNAKLTKLQNACLASNSHGGVMGANDQSSTYKWAKLSGSLPSDYANSGLTGSEFKPSNDLYGSFCAVKVTLQSDDQVIRDALNGTLVGKKEKAVEGKYRDDGFIDLTAGQYRYFAVGDPIVCGGWLTGEQLEKIASVVEANARAQAKDEQPKNLRLWMTALGAVGAGTGGAFLGDGIQKGTVGANFFGLKNTKTIGKNIQTNIESCNKAKSDLLSAIKSKYTKVADDGELEDELSKVTVTLFNDLKNAMKGQEETNLNNLGTKLTSWKDAVIDYCNVQDDGKCDWKGVDAKDETGDARDAVIAVNCNKLTEKCGEGYKWDEDSEKCVIDKNKNAGKWIGGATMALAGGGLAYAATDAALDAKLDQAGNEAYQAFMDSVGNKIHCYIGSQKVGSYGSIIETSME